MDIKEEALSNKLLCHTCLNVGRNIFSVTNENLKKYYSDVLDEVPLNKSKPFNYLLVCWECEVSLKKCWAFREQVKDSYRILQTYTAENLHECILSSASSQPRLTIHHNKPINILDGENEEISETTIAHVKVENIRWDYNKGESSDTKNEPVSEIDSGEEVESELQTVICCIENGERENKRSGSSKDKTERTMKIIESHKNNDQQYSAKSSTAIVNETEADLPLFHGREVRKLSESQTESIKNWECSKDLAETSSSERDNESSDNFDSESVTDEQELEVESKCNSSSITEEDGKSSSKNKKRKIIGSVENFKKKKVKKKKFKLEKESKKVLTVELSYEEMVLERENETKRESYVNAEYKCQTCIIGFMQSKSYRRHITTKHSPTIGEYRCPICETIISSVDSFTAHYKRHMRRYECSICHKRTTDLKVMHQHYYATHEISLKQYTCNVCGKISNSIDTHRYHTDSHKARVQCPDCDKTFRHRAGLMNHRLAVHERSANKFPCELCDKVFRWKNSLNRHKEKHDAKVKSMSSFPYCSLCRIHFASVCSYQRHMKNSLKHVTQDQLRYICDHCNRRFCDKTKLRDHIEEKHLHMTFHCHICTKPYKNRVGLDQHIRNVHKGRPKNKMCHHCGRGFPTKVQLESHIRTHTGERPFICEYCPTTFSQQSNLTKHYRQVHLNIKSKRYPMCKKRNDDLQQVCKVVALNSGQVIDDSYRPMTIPYSPSRPAEYLEY